MDRKITFGICLLVIGYLLLLMFRMKTHSYRRDVRYIKRELSMARSEGDVRFWKRRLRCVRLGAITGMSPELWENLFTRNH